jgi:DNA polymerase elongation subunit (family B)
MSYRNAVYDSRSGCIKLFTWDEDGRRIAIDSSFSPYLYLEDVRGEEKSLYNTKVKKRVFNNGYERYKFIQDSGIKRVYENVPPVQQYLIDMFWKENETDEFLKNDIKVMFIDIETYSVDTFPDVDNPTHPINVITCYDSLNKQYDTFGVGPYKNNDSDVRYHHCKSEKDLFEKFLIYMANDFPDIISGWNSEAFDIPYIICRMGRVLNEDDVARLSPVGRVYSRLRKGLFGTEFSRYYMDGISSIDYLDVYKRFCMTLRQSYKLDAIGELELGQKKIDYGDMSLAELSKKDWQKFVEYNIQDVRLLVALEEKLQYFNLLRMLAYVGCTTFEGAMGTVATVNGALIVKARHRGVIMSTFVRNASTDKNPGAYVAEPKRGFKSNVISFDANSLYPNVMISLNLSPETKIGKVSKIDKDTINIHHISGKEFNLNSKQFAEFIKKEQCALTKAGFLFSQKKKGIIPEFLDYYYNKRVEIKKRLYSTKLELNDIKDKNDINSSSELKGKYTELKYEAQRLEAQQMTVKILINATYGYMGNKHAPIGDDDIAASVTLTGQSVIKESGVILQRHLEQEYGITNKDMLEGSWVYSDTDSCYFSLECIKDKVPLLDKDGEISNEFYSAADKLENYLNQEITSWSKKALLTNDSRFMFKREVIADTAMFLQKKRYVMHILDDEGIKTKKFKYKGVEVVRSTMPDEIKPYAKQIIETMLSTRDLTATNKILNKAYETFLTLKPEDISYVMGLGNYEKSAAKCDGLNIGKGVPIHAKAAHLHNQVNRKLGIEDKYEDIGSGDKVRYFYVEQPNKYGVNVIGFKYEFPKEYNELFNLDYDKMFDKILFEGMKRFYDSVKWSVRNPSDNVNVELFDLFG